MKSTRFRQLPLLFFLSISFTICSLSAIAQRSAYGGDEDEDDPYDCKSYFMYGLKHVTNNVYLGRKDSVAIPYTSPYLGYHFAKGFYAKGSISFSGETKKRVDLANIELGYDHSIGEHFVGGGGIDKSFYNKNSNNVRANAKGSAYAYLQFENEIVTPQLSLNLNVNKKSSDFVANFQLEHEFRSENRKLHIIPIAALNMGTQHYLDEYFLNRFSRTDKSLKLKKAIDGAGRFKMLDYEMSVKGTYTTGKWLFTLLPTIAIPVNPAVVNLPQRTVTETLSNSFYVELDICHR